MPTADEIRRGTRIRRLSDGKRFKVSEKEETSMRLKGTGKDPDRYPEGLVFDADLEGAQRYIEQGVAVALDPKDDPARTESQVADAKVRGANLTNPVDAELASEMSDDEAHAIVSGADPSGDVADHEERGLGSDQKLASKRRAGTVDGPQPVRREGARPGPVVSSGTGRPGPSVTSRASLEEAVQADLASEDSDSSDDEEFDSDVYTSASAQRAAEAAGVDPSDVDGSGSDGRITVKDVEKAKAAA